MGLLDLLFGQEAQGGGILGGGLPPEALGYAQTPARSAMFPPPPMAPAAPAAQAAPGPGPGDRLMAALGSFVNSGGFLPAVTNAIEGFSTGQRADDRGKLEAAASRVLAAEVKAGRLTPDQAKMIQSNPESWKDLGKAIISPETVSIGQTLIRKDAFGNVKPVYVEPYKPEMVEQYDPRTGRMVKAPYQLPQPQGASGLVGAAPQVPVPAAAPSVAAPSVPSTARTWGDKEAEAAGLYEPSTKVAQAGGPLRSPGVAGGFYSAPGASEKEEQQQTGKGLGEAYVGYQKGAASSVKTLGTLSRMEQLNNDPRLPQGKLAPYNQGFRSMLASFGIDPKSVAPGEELTALTNKMVLDANNGSLGAGVSNADVEFLKNISPNLAQTKEGRSQIIQTLKAMQQRNIEVYNQAKQFKAANGTLDGFEIALADWANKNPLFANRESAAAAQPGGIPTPKAGVVMQGYRFKGGNPADPASWVKVQ